jgi:hypothetical protein
MKYTPWWRSDILVCAPESHCLHANIDKERGQYILWFYHHTPVANYPDMQNSIIVNFDKYGDIDKLKQELIELMREVLI